MLPSLSLVAGAPAPTDVWEVVSAKGAFSGRDESGSFAYNGHVCLFGGRGVLPIDCFDPEKQKWHTKSTTTDDIHHVQPVVFNDEVWVVAGWHGTWPGPWCCPSGPAKKGADCVGCGERELQNTLIYDPRQDQLREGCAIPVEFARGSAGVVVFGTKIYVVNGATNGHQKDYGAKAYRGFSSFDPVKCKWKALDAVPAYNRDHYLAALVGSTIVLAAGRDSPRSSEVELSIHHTVAPVEWYDLGPSGDGAWHEGASLPTPRAGNALAVDAVGGRVIVVGGETDHNTKNMPSECREASSVPSVAQREVEAYDVAADKWTPLPSLLTGRHTAAAAVVGDAGALMLLAAGGVGCTGAAPLLTTTEALPYRAPPRLSPPPPPPPPPPPASSQPPIVARLPSPSPPAAVTTLEASPPPTLATGALEPGLAAAAAAAGTEQQQLLQPPPHRQYTDAGILADGSALEAQQPVDDLTARDRLVDKVQLAFALSIPAVATALLLRCMCLDPSAQGSTTRGKSKKGGGKTKKAPKGSGYTSSGGYNSL